MGMGKLGVPRNGYEPRRINRNGDEADISNDGPTVLQLKQLLEVRQARADYFGTTFFTDPAWDILLRAYIAYLSNERLKVQLLYDSAPVPTTTAIRWVRALHHQGWLDHHGVSLDDEQSWVELSGVGRKAMQRFWSATWRSVFPI